MFKTLTTFTCCGFTMHGMIDQMHANDSISIEILDLPLDMYAKMFQKLEFIAEKDGRRLLFVGAIESIEHDSILAIKLNNGGAKLAQ